MVTRHVHPRDICLTASACVEPQRSMAIPYAVEAARRVHLQNDCIQATVVSVASRDLLASMLMVNSCFCKAAAQDSQNAQVSTAGKVHSGMLFYSSATNVVQLCNALRFDVG